MNHFSSVRKASRREQGQVLIFAAISIFCLVAAVGLVINTGQVVHDKIRLQSAADSAALAAAQVQANSLSTIAWLNDGMALIYYNLLKYASDVAVLGTLAAIKNHGPPYPSDAVVGLPNAVARYSEAYTRAESWIPKGEDWLSMIYRMQCGIALITPVLAEKEAYRLAVANGAEVAALFPKFTMFPDPGNYIRVDIQRIPGGWRLVSSTEMVVEATKTGTESWHIFMQSPDSTINVDIEKSGESWYKITYDDGKVAKTIFVDKNVNGDITVDSDGAKVTKNADGSTTVCQNGKCVDFKSGPNGLMTNDGSGWKEVPQQDSVDVNGAKVKVQNFEGLNVGSAQVWPNHIVIGNTLITFADPVQIVTQFGPVSLNVKDDQAIANKLSTANATGEWYPLWDAKWSNYWSDKLRHRMSENGADAWVYEYEKNSSYLQPEDMNRFALEHALGDNDAFAKGSGSPPLWTTWFSPLLGRNPNPLKYHQTRPCWHPSDLVCPVHGVDDSTDPDEPNGYWHAEDGSKVPCPICLGIDYDEDGKSDVRVYQNDTFSAKGDAGFDKQDRQSVDFPGNLVLAEDFFKFGVSVAVWRSPKQAPFMAMLFPGPTSGSFAVASARAGFYDHDTDGYRYFFEDPEDREDWVQTSYANLYEPHWMAKLVPVNDVIRKVDIDASDVDSGANYLFRSLAETQYYKDYFSSASYEGSKLYSLKAPWNGASFNLSGKELPDALEH